MVCSLLMCYRQKNGAAVCQVDLVNPLCPAPFSLLLSLSLSLSALETFCKVMLPSAVGIGLPAITSTVKPQRA